MIGAAFAAAAIVLAATLIRAEAPARMHAVVETRIER